MSHQSKRTDVSVIQEKEINLPRLRGKKALMYNALRSTLGVITEACKKTGISRSAHYSWLEKDPGYAAWVDSIQDIKVDFYEGALNRLVDEGNITAVIFALKTQAKHRGYVESKTITHEGEVDFSHRLLKELNDESD
jgi:hypothetical protein